MTTVGWLDDRPLEDLGLTVVSLEGWWNVPTLTFPTVALPGRRGNRQSDRGMTVAARRVPLQSMLSALSLAERVTKLDALAEALTGLHEFRIADDPDRVAYGTLASGTVQFFAPQLTDPEVDPVYELLFENPHKFDRLEQMLVAPAAALAKAVPCGTVPHRGRLWVMDTLASRTVEVLSADGTALYQLRLTGTLASGEYLEIDMDQDAPTITLVQSAGTVRVDAFGWLNPFDALPIFDPKDRPGIRHSGGGDLVLFYRRAYYV